MRILIATVGGKPQPIRQSIIQNRPDKIWFICSDDAESTRGSYTQIEEIIKGLPHPLPTYEVVKLKELDNVCVCHETSSELINRVRKDYPAAEITADFSGGTKPMTAGLAIAATGHSDIRLSFVSGTRADLRQVVPGTESVRLLLPTSILLERYRELAGAAFKRFDYASAVDICRMALAIPGIDSRGSANFQYWLTLALAYRAWDDFDHTGAWRLLSLLKRYEPKQCAFLEAVIWSRRVLAPDYGKDLNGITARNKGHGYELVEDLIMNAKRSAEATRFDDSAARLYRATELLLQLRLKLAHGIENGNVDTGLLPADLQSRYEQMRNYRGYIELALMKSLQLLVDLSEAKINEPLGPLLKNRRNEIRNFIEKRNVSILAHGVSPIRQTDFQKMEAEVCGLVDTAFKTMKLKSCISPVQLPSSLPQPPPSGA
ncbi:MAG: TIGR02710 family CRISPR-associated CARF protein [Chloroflexota bacterium]